MTPPWRPWPPGQGHGVVGWICSNLQEPCYLPCPPTPVQVDLNLSLTSYGRWMPGAVGGWGWGLHPRAECVPVAPTSRPWRWGILVLPPGSLPCGPCSAVGKARSPKAALRLHMNDTRALGRGQQGPWVQREEATAAPSCLPSLFSTSGGLQGPEPQTYSLTP